MAETEETTRKIHQDPVWVWLSALGVTSVVTYLANSFLLDTRIAGYKVGLFAIAIIGFGCFLLAATTLGRLWKRRYIINSGLQNTVIFSLVSLIALIILDSAFSAYIQVSSPKSTTNERLFDKNVWVGELYPRLYFPTEQNFRLHKPGVTVSGAHYGGWYNKSMLASTVLVNDILNRRSINIEIDKNGFREDTPIESANIFALGDSFAFGWGINKKDLWSSIIEKNIGQTVFNLGILDSSPKQELELLKNVLQNYPVTIDHVLWLIYEGNDLEDNYNETAPFVTGSKKKTGIKHLILISNLFRGLKNNSVIHNFRTRRAQFDAGKTPASPNEIREIEGVNLAIPVFFSDKLGQCMLHPYYIKQASQPESYILNHPNRPRLDKTFNEMRDLANKYNFDVTVIIAPTKVRLHGKYFNVVPESSESPHFINYVENLSKSIGFTVVNLHSLLQPYAGSSILYFCDDDHWNEEGHRLAAKSVLQETFAHDMRL